MLFHMRRSIFLILLLASLSACLSVPPLSQNTQPMLAVDTSWKQGKGFNLEEAKALVEFCIALDYGEKEYIGDIPRPMNASGWEEIYPFHERLPAHHPSVFAMLD